MRNEVFGLLFYDYRGPRLYFVPSRDLVQADFFEGRKRVREALDAVCGSGFWPPERARDQLLRVLDTLEEKGLIHGQ